MAINKKLIFWKSSTFNPPTSPSDTTKDVLWNSIVFFDSTAGTYANSIWTHGKVFGSGVWGTNQTNYVPLAIGNTTYNLSKDGHTHSYLPLSGGTLTGQINLTTTTITTPPANNIALAAKSDGLYQKLSTGVESKLSIDGHTHSYLPLTGGTLTGDTTFNTNIIANNGIKHVNGEVTIFDTIAIKNNTSIPSGYIKFVTPIKTAINQMFSIDIVGYDYSAGKSIDFTVVGYAYSGTDSVINIGFSNRSSFNKQVRIVLENRGLGYRQMVIALGADDGSGTSSQTWYYQKFSATIRLWYGGATIYNTSDFSWVNGETTLASGYWQSSNINNQWLDGQVGSINTSGVVTAATANFTNLTANYLPKQTASGLANSIIYDNGTNVGIGVTSPAEKLDIAGNIYLTDATTSTIRANKELVLRQDGDVYGSSILRLKNRQGENGAVFESTHPTVTIVDFQFKTAANQRMIRLEGRSGVSAKAGTPSFHIGGTNIDQPSLAVGDTYVAVKERLSVGSYDYSSYALNVVGTINATSYKTKTGTANQLLVADGTVINKAELTAYGAELVTSPITGTLTLKNSTETVLAGALTTSNVFTVALPTPVSGKVNESVLIFKIGATLPTITQPSGIVWRGLTPTLSINTNWTIVYEQVNTTGSTFEIWATACRNV